MKSKIVFVGILLLGLLTGCGGGGGGDGGSIVAPPPPSPPPPPPPTGGIGRTGFAYGPVTTFGSIVVNGVRYETDSAEFFVDDGSGSQGDLRVGDVVVVKGTINDDGLSGTADQVFFDDAVTGPVQSVDPALSEMVVLGQRVLVGPDTSFDDSFVNPSLAGMTIGDIVEITGQFDANGDILATRIEPKPAALLYEVHGIVSNLDAGNSTFQLGNLVVDYEEAQIDNDFPGGQISNGDFVEAKGSPPLGGAGELIATIVDFESLLPNPVDGDRVEIEGFITRFISAQDFDVAGLPVTTSGSTVFQGGDATNLDLNVKVEVEGDVNASGVLVATKVDIRRSKAVRAIGSADSVDAANDSLVMLGITFTVDALTRLEDKVSNNRVDPLTLDDLNAGDYLEIRGSEFPAGSGTILATILERDDPDPETILQGFVESVAQPSLTILGVTINTSGGTVFRDEADQPITSLEFFGRVEQGSLIKATGTESSDAVISAAEVEFELDL